MSTNVIALLDSTNSSLEGLDCLVAVSLEPFDNLTDDPIADYGQWPTTDDDFYDLTVSEAEFWTRATLSDVVAWRRCDLELRLRLQFPWLAAEEDAPMLEALVDESYPIEYEFVLNVFDVQTV